MFGINRETARILLGVLSAATMVGATMGSSYARPHPGLKSAVARAAIDGDSKSAEATPTQTPVYWASVFQIEAAKQYLLRAVGTMQDAQSAIPGVGDKLFDAP